MSSYGGRANHAVEPLCRLPMLGGLWYSETVEGEPPQPSDGDGVRPLVVAAEYPCPEVARVGECISVRATFLGATATAHVEAFWEALRRGGADPGLGLGDDRVLFDLLPAQPDQTETMRLSLEPMGVAAMIPWVRVELTGPLIVKTRAGDGRRRLVDAPRLAHLIRAWDSLAALFRYEGDSLPESILPRIRTLADGVATIAQAFTVVGQTKSSHRTHERWEERGVVGWGEYGPLPAELVPWLYWAGRLHVGNHRVAGAGGWRVLGPDHSALTPFRSGMLLQPQVQGRHDRGELSGCRRGRFDDEHRGGAPADV